MWRTISPDGKSVTLSRFEGFDSALVCNPNSIEAQELKTACAVDVETSGLDKFRDVVLEIGIRTFYFDPTNGKILGLGKSLSQLNDPGRPIDSKINKLTGLKNKDLKEQKIIWSEVGEMLSNCHLIIAHNANFDRAFIDRSTKYSERAVWSCSMRQIDWIEHGLPSTNLQLLAAFHGYFSSAHRALVDADMVIQILKLNPKYLLELYENAHEPRIRIKLLNTDYNDRLEIRRMGYMWSPGTKTWSKSILRKNLEAEEKNISSLFHKSAPQYELEEIPLADNFKF